LPIADCRFVIRRSTAQLAIGNRQSAMN